MRLKDIKTEKQFWDFANNWYQRAHNLREIWQDSKGKKERQVKALKLWLIMYERIMKIMPIAIKINLPK